MVDNPRDWQPPYEDDDEFWQRFEDSLNAAQGKNPSAPEPASPPEDFQDRFVPPEPPPITAPPDAIARAAWIAAIGGPALAVIGFVLGVSGFLGSIGITAAIIGFVVLVARRDHHVPPGEDHGDGAVV